MKTFINTGWNPSTFTTCDDPELRVVERDNGVRWGLCFEVGNHDIDYINLEHPSRTTDAINKDVLSLPVYNEEGKIISTVERVLRSAIELDLSLQEQYKEFLDKQIRDEDQDCIIFDN